MNQKLNDRLISFRKPFQITLTCIYTMAAIMCLAYIFRKEFVKARVSREYYTHYVYGGVITLFLLAFSHFM